MAKLGPTSPLLKVHVRRWNVGVTLKSTWPMEVETFMMPWTELLMFRKSVSRILRRSSTVPLLDLPQSSKSKCSGFSLIRIKSRHTNRQIIFSCLRRSTWTGTWTTRIQHLWKRGASAGSGRRTLLALKPAGQSYLEQRYDHPSTGLLC